MVNTYPYGSSDRLVGPTLNNDFELSAGVVPPSGMAGGAGQFKLWMDTSVNPQPALRIVTAARAMAGVYVPSEWGLLGRLDLNTRQFQYQGTWGGDLTVSGNIAGASLFLNGSIFFNGVTFASSDGVTSHIFDGTGGNAIHLQAGINYYDADVHDFRNNIGTTNLLTLDGNGVTLNGSTIHFVGSSGSVNTTGGPMLYADQSNHVYKQGSGNGSWLFQNYAGAVVASLSSAGHLNVSGNLNVVGQLAANTINASSTINAVQYNLSGGPFAVNNGTATVIYDNTGAPAIHLWPAIIYYDADSHHFRNNAGGEMVTIDSTGALYSIGNIHSGQALYLGNPFILFNNNTGLTQGPYMQADNADWIFRRGPGVGKFFFTNSDGGVVLSIDGGGSVIVTGYMLSLGYQTRAGIAGGGTGNHFNIEWRPGAHLWVDNTDQGAFILEVGGNVNVPGILYCNNVPFLRADTHDTGGFNSIYDNTGIESIQLGNPGAFINYHSQSSHVFRERLSIAATNYVLFNASGTYNVSGAWGLISDAETKDDITLYDRGLDAILALKPVSYRYKPGTPFADPDRTLRYGLVAQEVEAVIPEMISEASFRVGEADVSHKTMSPGHLVYVLVNAVQQLAARVEAIEASA